MECIKVNFCAAPSSRKSTVCAGLESELKQMAINCDTSKEYARQYIQNYGVPTDMFEQLIIFENQDIRDKGIANVSEIMLCDTPAVASYIFGKRLLQQKLAEEFRKDIKPSEYKYLEELHNKCLKKLNWYDIIIVFPPHDPVVQDGTRTETEQDKLDIYNALVGFLNAENVKYHMVDGEVPTKIALCKEIILTERERRERAKQPGW